MFHFSLDVLALRIAGGYETLIPGSSQIALTTLVT